MDPTTIDMSPKCAAIISENSEIPPDVTFKFTQDIDGDNKVAAHKLILAMVSQVFRSMFFVHNTKDRSANEITIEDSTKAAFQIMIEAIYNVKTMRESLQEKTIHEIFAVLYLVTKYKIPELELAAEECLSSFPITEDNVLEVASDAMEYETTFQSATQNILLACANFLKPKFSDNFSLLEFVADNGDHMATVHKLAVLIRDLCCTNCGNHPCQSGLVIEETQFRVGLKVAYNPAIQTRVGYQGYWEAYLTHLTGEVKELLCLNRVMITAITYKPTTDNVVINTTRDYVTKHNEQCTFIFNCK